MNIYILNFAKKHLIFFSNEGLASKGRDFSSFPSRFFDAALESATLIAAPCAAQTEDNQENRSRNDIFGDSRPIAAASCWHVHGIKRTAANN